MNKLTTIFKYVMLIAFLAVIKPHFGQVSGIVNANSLTDSSEFVIQNWSTENGLPQNSINGMLQTQDGFLWVATFYGLVRFDGVDFKLFTSWNTDKMSSNGVLRLFESADGYLWFITDDHRVHKSKNGVIEKVHSSPIGIVSFAQGRGDTILVCDIEGDADYISNGKSSHAVDVPKAKQMVSMDDYSIYFSSNDGLFTLDKGNAVRVDSTELKGCHWMYPDGDTLWINTDRGFGYVVDRKFHLHPLAASLKKERLNSFAKTNDELWFGTSNKGVLRIVNGEINRITTADGLSSNKVRTLFEDSEGNIWVGTWDAGLNKLQRRLFKTYGVSSGLGAEVVNPIAQRKNGDILIGTNCGGVSKYKDSKIVPAYVDTVANKCVWSIFEDDQENVWLGSYWGGVTRISSSGDVSYYKVDDGLPGNIVFAIASGPDGEIWVGTEQGIAVFNGESFVPNVATTGMKITYLFADHDGEMWFGSNEGLGLITDNGYKIYTTRDGLSNNHVRCIYEDEEGVFWIGTYGGSLNRMLQSKITNYPVAVGAFNQNVSGITEDEFGYLWMTSNHGLYCIKRSELNDFALGKITELRPQHFDRNYGFMASEFNGGFQQSVLRAKDGDLWFPSTKGAVRLRPDDYKPHLLNNRVIVDKIITDDSTYTDFSKNIEVPYDNSRVEIVFTIPRFNSANDVRFEYRFQSDNKVIQLGNKRSILFHAMPSGDYQMQIRAEGRDQTLTELKFSISTPFWKTWWFVGLIIGVVLLLMTWITNNRIKTSQRRERAKTEVEKRIAGLELKALRAQMNPHFIFNCLNSIQHFIAINDELGANKYLGKFSSLMRMTLEHTSTSDVKLAREVELLRLYMELEKLRFEDGFDFEIVVDDSIDQQYYEIPGMLIQPFVENSIVHGFSRDKGKGKLEVRFETNDGVMDCIIDDNGVGRIATATRKKEKKYESKGVAITDERIKGINELKNMDISFKIIDKEDDNGQPLGTTVIISFPIEDIA